MPVPAPQRSDRQRPAAGLRGDFGGLSGWLLSSDLLLHPADPAELPRGAVPVGRRHLSMRSPAIRARCARPVAPARLDLFCAFSRRGPLARATVAPRKRSRSQSPGPPLCLPRHPRRQQDLRGRADRRGYPTAATMTSRCVGSKHGQPEWRPAREIFLLLARMSVGCRRSRSLPASSSHS